MKGQHIEWEKVFANDATDRGLVTGNTERVYKLEPKTIK